MKKTKDTSNGFVLDFHEFNMNLMGMKDLFIDSNQQALIKKNDSILQSQSKPAQIELLLYRGIPNPVCYKNSNKYRETYFKRSIDLKSGDIFYMPEYSFWSKEISYSKNFIGLDTQNTGILYELLCPKGTNIYTNEYQIFKRYTKFLCLSNEKIIEDKMAYHLIKLKVLPRDIAEYSNQFFPRHFSKIKNFLKFLLNGAK